METEANATTAPGVHADLILLASAFSLMFLGLGMVFIASNVMAQANYSDPFYFVKRQGMYAVLGVGALLLGRKIDYRKYQRWVYPFLFISLICLILVFIPGIGGKVRGAARWIRLGPLTLQPSEFMKPAIVLTLARFYELVPAGEIRKWRALWPAVALLGVGAGRIGPGDFLCNGRHGPNASCLSFYVLSQSGSWLGPGGPTRRTFLD